MSGPATPGFGPQPSDGPPGSGPAPGYGAAPESGPPGYGLGYGGPGPDRPAPMGPVTTKFARVDPGPSQAFGIAAALVTLLGAVAVILAFTSVNWFKGATSSDPARFGNIRSLLDSSGASAATLAKAYFGWLGWTLLAVAVLTAILAAVPTIGAAFRVIGPVVALGAVIVTFFAIQLLKSGISADQALSSYGDYLKNARLGFYLALGGFVLIGVGAALGPRHQRR